MAGPRYAVGTSGYSFADWAGTFYPPGTRRGDMLEIYAGRFETVELNFSFYRMPTAEALARMAARTPEGFTFWVKANRQITHEGDPSVTAAFVDALAPLQSAGRLAGVLLQFPQSFHRTAASRQHLADALAAFQNRLAEPLAVEFRHASWDHPRTCDGLRTRNVSVVVPDAPAIPALFRPEPIVTGPVGYLRLHSRDARKWYAGAAERYDYDYREDELRDILSHWQGPAAAAETTYTFFNNCHRGQAAANAQAFRRILGQID